jgi:hypothetical protein
MELAKNRMWSLPVPGKMVRRAEMGVLGLSGGTNRDMSGIDEFGSGHRFCC